MGLYGTFPSPKKALINQIQRTKATTTNAARNTAFRPVRTSDKLENRIMLNAVTNVSVREEMVETDEKMIPMITRREQFKGR